MPKSSKVIDPSSTPIRLSILWHQHQPYYRVGDRFVMPWVWLHATKDYLEMAQHLERHPGVKATINLVPSLIKQIEEYLSGTVRDPIIELMAKPATELSDADKETLLENFFLANPSTVIARSPRYAELYHRWRAHHLHFSEQDFRDMAIHYSLAWTGEINRRTEPWNKLVAKDRNFSEQDREELVTAQRAAVAEIFPLHQRLADRGQIELSTTPFYHPILPLILDTNAAREAIRDISLPLQRFERPEDAELQLHKAKSLFKSTFHRESHGIWPSEGSVSDAALRLIAQNGFLWVATDEGVLDRSLGHHGRSVSPLVHTGLARYTPWRFHSDAGEITMFFRDHRISDNIGFTYQSWDAADAVADLLSHVESVRQRILDTAPEELPNACVSVILDGENCWEYYANNGFEFLDTLYRELEQRPTIQTCTFSEVAASSKKYPELRHVVAGSWINSNFRIWIGHHEDNAAWDALASARQALAEAEEHQKHLPAAKKPAAKEKLEAAREHLLIAEGSDWCWWYGDDHHSVQRDLFDAIFRQHLRAAYALIGLPVPEDLLLPIIDRPGLAERYHRPSQQESRPGVVPKIAGKLLNDSWIGIPNSAPPKVFGAMHRSYDREIEDLRLARVGDEVLLRLILSPPIPEQSSVVVTLDEHAGVLVRFGDAGVELRTPSGVTPARGFFDETIECAIPGELLHGTNTLRIKLEVHEADGRSTLIPESGTIECTVSEVEGAV